MLQSAYVVVPAPTLDVATMFFFPPILRNHAVNVGEMTDSKGHQGGRIHEPLSDSPIKRWVLLDGNRYVLSVMFSIATLLIMAGIGFAGYISVTEPQTATTLVAATAVGTLPLITIVLAINQLVLSQELGWAGGLETRSGAMTTFRRDVEEITDRQ